MCVGCVLVRLYMQRHMCRINIACVPLCPSYCPTHISQQRNPWETRGHTSRQSSLGATTPAGSKQTSPRASWGAPPALQQARPGAPQPGAPRPRARAPTSASSVGSKGSRQGISIVADARPPRAPAGGGVPGTAAQRNRGDGRRASRVSHGSLGDVHHSSTATLAVQDASGVVAAAQTRTEPSANNASAATPAREGRSLAGTRAGAHCLEFIIKESDTMSGDGHASKQPATKQIATVMAIAPQGMTCSGNVRW